MDNPQNPLPLSSLGSLDSSAIPDRPRLSPRAAAKTRRNIYMGQEYLDMEAIVVQERKRTGKDISVADLIRTACRSYVESYWKTVANS